MLRSLPQTCRSLRNVALALLWSDVNIRSIEELGRVRDTLRAEPFLHAHIVSFTFCWDLRTTFSGNEFREAGMRRLECAFRDQSQVYVEMLERLGREEKRQILMSKEGGPLVASFFPASVLPSRQVYRLHRDPGHPPLIEGRDPMCVSSYDWAAPCSFVDLVGNVASLRLGA